MCMPTDCPVCNKKTWRGCGMHIPMAMSQSPKDSWCTCVPADGSAKGEYPPMAGAGKAADV